MEQMQRAGRRHALPRRRPRLATTLGLGALLVSMVLVACGQDAGASAQAAKAKLDAELATASTVAGVPDGLLQPLMTQERTIARGTTSGSDKAYQDAVTAYTRLYNQVVAIEHMTPEQAHTQASKDLDHLNAALQAVQKAGFVESAQYQQNLQTAQQRLGAATTTKDFFTVDSYIEAQTAAVQMIEPVYKQMQALDAQVNAQDKTLGIVSAVPQPLQCAVGDVDNFWWANPDINVASQAGQNSPTYEYQRWPTQNLAAFRAATTAQQYQQLSALMTAQSQQLAADVADIAPQLAHQMVQSFVTDVQTYQQYGGKDASFQQQASQDQQALDAAKTLGDFSAVAQTVQKQRQAFAFPLLKVQTQHDMDTLTQLVLQADSLTTYDSYDGVHYPNGYEYLGIEYGKGRDWGADPLDKYDTEHYLGGTGVGDARARLANAQTPDDYQAVDSELQMFITNIQAMLTDMGQMPKDSGARQAWSMQVHQTDLDLINHYGLQNQKVIVVSLREQKARLFDNGKLVTGSDGQPYAFDVTTGDPNLPSVPGVHCVMPWTKQVNYLDKAPDYLKGTPYWYAPTPIHFGFVYSDYGFFMHDAWWRDATGMGYMTNLPHYDPEAFNGGSHGCINFHYANGDMAKVFNFADEGTPIIVY